MGVKSFYSNMVINDEENQDQNPEKQKLKMSNYIKIDSH